MKPSIALAATLAFAATSVLAQLGGPQGSIGKSAPAKSGVAPAKSPASLPPPVSGTSVQKADLRIVKVEHKVVMQHCKASAPFAEVVATVRNKGNIASAGLNDPSAIAAVFKVSGVEQRFPAAGGLMPLPPDGTQVVVMKIPFNDGLFPVEKLPDGWLARKSMTSYQIQVNAAGLIDENKTGDKGAIHQVQVTKEQCPELYHTIPPTDTFEQFQKYCQEIQVKMKPMCAFSNAFGPGLSPEQLAATKKLPHLCSACKAACPSCGYVPGVAD